MTQLPRVLLAEDDRAMRVMLCALLTRSGFDVVAYESGRALIMEIERAHEGATALPSVIISDVQMPGVSGLDVLHVAQKCLPQVPVVLVTAFGDGRTHRRARELGARVLLDKPFDLSEFRDLVIEAATPQVDGQA